jgi:hypothetical protein
MIKRLGVYSLPEDTDGDEFWRYHTQEHAQQAKQAFGDYLKRYTINRIRRLIAGEGDWFGLVETWWDSQADVDRGFANLNTTMLPNGLSISDDFGSRVDRYTSFEVDEFVALDKLKGEAIKRMTFYQLVDGIDGDDFFHYHTQKHAADVLNASQTDYARKKYVINKIKRVIKGNERVFGFIETWWTNHTDMDRDLDELGRAKLSDGTSLVNEFFEQVENVVVYEVEEFIAKG